jgi:hypothetical protein
VQGNGERNGLLGRSDGEEESNYSSKGENLSLNFGAVHGEYLGGEDGPRTALNRADRSGAWNPEVSKQALIALFADEVTHPVVVGTAAGSGRRGAW